MMATTLPDGQGEDMVGQLMPAILACTQCCDYGHLVNVGGKTAKAVPARRHMSGNHFLL